MTEETAADELGENLEQAQTRGNDGNGNGNGSNEGGLEKNGLAQPSAEAVSPPLCCIDNDSDSNRDVMEDHPLEGSTSARSTERSNSADISPERPDNPPRPANIISSSSNPGPPTPVSPSTATAVAPASEPTMDPAAKPKAKDGVVMDNIASSESGLIHEAADAPTAKSTTQDPNSRPKKAKSKSSTSPPKLRKVKKPKPIASQRKHGAPPSVFRKSLPQSQRSPVSGQEHDESAFGPFVESVISSDWNPFGEKDLPGGAFHVDDDEDTKVSAGGSPAVLRCRRASSSSAQQLPPPPGAELDGLRRVFDSEYERALEDQEISWRARFGATRLSFIISALLMVVYLWLGCMFYRSEAGWSVPDALLFTVYTVTTVGYGGPQPLPNTGAFHAFTSVYVLVGISLVTVLGAHTFQLVTLEATRMRSSPWGRRGRHVGEGGDETLPPDGLGKEGTLTREVDRYRQQFMTELEDIAREQPILDATLVRIREFRLYMKTTRSGRLLSVALPFLGMIFLGAAVVGSIEEWTPLESLYWSIVTLTTVGYGDYVPTRNSSVWFCTLFFIPSSLFFLSFLLAHVAKSYIRLHAIHVTRLERKMRKENERRRLEVEREKKASGDAEAVANDDANHTLEKPPPQHESPGGPTPPDDMEKGFTTVISYMEEDEIGNSPTKSSGLFGDQASMVDDVRKCDPLSSESSPAQRYRENVIRNKEAAPDPSVGNRAYSFAEALQSLNRDAQSSQASSDVSSQSDQFANEGNDTSKPSLEVRLRVQARLARIIAEEVAGHQTGVVIKGSMVSLTVGSLRDTADKWRLPPQAWKAFRAVAFRSLLFVGERELISEGGDALLRLNVVEFHQIFSPLLAAMGDGSSMGAWLAATDVLADVELRGGARYGRGKPIFSGTFT